MLFVLWRLVLWVVGWAALESSQSFFSVARLIAGYGNVTDASRITPEFVLGSAWVQWDSNWYLSIVEQGYQYEAAKPSNIAFFPFYPMLIRAFMPITFNNAVLSGLIIANVSLLAGIILLTDLVARDFGAMVAYRTVSALLLFPTSFFFGALYTESLALALLALTLWAVRREHWWLAGIAGLFLSATRVPGVLIAPVLALALISRNGWRWPRFQPVLLTPLLPVAGLGLFMLYQWHRFGSPFVFLQIQDVWDQNLSPPWVQPLKMIESIVTRSAQWNGPWPMRVVQLVPRYIRFCAFWPGMVSCATWENIHISNEQVKNAPSWKN
jgi:Gpi18-like mannosyltransferase